MRKTIIQSVVIAGLFLSGISASAQKVPFYDKGYAGDVELGFLVKGIPMPPCPPRTGSASAADGSSDWAEPSSPVCIRG